MDLVLLAALLSREAGSTLAFELLDQDEYANRLKQENSCETLPLSDLRGHRLKGPQ
jgi:hypothetical protein